MLAALHGRVAMVEASRMPSVACISQSLPEIQLESELMVKIGERPVAFAQDHEVISGVYTLDGCV